MEDIKKEIERALIKVKDKYNLEGLNVEIVEGTEASVNSSLIRIGKEIPLELVESIVLHECYHVILNINQTEDFKEKDKGNIIPYLKTKTRIWDKIKSDFPELTEKIEKIKVIYGHKSVY